MPIEYRIDHERRLVLTRGVGTLTDADVFGYQREVWSRPDVDGYDELMDMTDVQHIAMPSVHRARDLAQLSAEMDGVSSYSKFAIVAPSDEAFGLGRMYQTFRELEAKGKKQVGVFRTREEAFAFLGIEDDDLPDQTRSTSRTSA